jgi:hypothetical protein
VQAAPVVRLEDEVALRVLVVVDRAGRRERDFELTRERVADVERASGQVMRFDRQVV